MLHALIHSPEAFLGYAELRRAVRVSKVKDESRLDTAV